MKTSKTATAVSPEEHDKRIKVAKALWFLEVGDSKPSDPHEAQAAFESVKTAMIGKAIKFDKILSRLGYKLHMTD